MAKPKKTQEASETPVVPVADEQISPPTEAPALKPGQRLSNHGNIIESY